MPTKGTRITNLRLGPDAEARLDQIATEKEWTKVQVVRRALEHYHRSVFGRRSSDLVPVRKRGPAAPE